MNRSAIVSLKLLLLAVLPLTAVAAETLYNGIVLPDQWPPRIKKFTREPMPVPYLEHRPDVVPIDVGRQLFVDDFLIENTTLHRTYCIARYHPACPVLKADKPWECEGRPASKELGLVKTGAKVAAPFSDGVWYDPVDSLFKMWYMAGYHRTTCYATSKEGMHWEKPALDVEPGSNVVLRHNPPTSGRDSLIVWLDQQEVDPSRRFKMFYFLRPDPKILNLFSFGERFSPDGIHWSEPVIRPQSPQIGDRTTIFFNPFRKVWVWSIKSGDDQLGRVRCYREHPDPVAGNEWGKDDVHLWTCADKLDPHNPNPKFADVQPQLYNLDAVAYESLMLGLFCIFQGPDPENYVKLQKPKRNEVLLGFSRDGFHWYRPDRRPFAAAEENDGAWNWSNVQSVGGGCLVVGENLYFYVSGWSSNNIVHDRTMNTGLAVLRRDGFASMDAGDTEGTLTTRPVMFHGKYLFVNADADKGELRVEVLDKDGKVIKPFTRSKCTRVRVDKTLQAVKWGRKAELSALAGQPVRFRFHLKNARLFSFWVSPEKSGASHGYVAAGGPGFTGPTDTVGDQ